LAGQIYGVFLGGEVVADGAADFADRGGGAGIRRYGSPGKVQHDLDEIMAIVTARPSG
jgi:hypothetical protein